MKAALAQQVSSLLKKRESYESNERITSHASNTVQSRGLNYSQRTSTEQISDRLSMDQLELSEIRVQNSRASRSPLIAAMQTRQNSAPKQPKITWQSDTLCIKENQISGWLRKTVQQVKIFQKSQFPLRFYVVNKNSKRMYIFDKPGGKLKQELHLNNVRCVVQLKSLNDGGPPMPMSPKTVKDLSGLPKDFEEPFAIFFDDTVFLLWAKNTQEQTLWRKELLQLTSKEEQLQIHSPSFLQQFESSTTYSYQLFQQLQGHRVVLQETPRHEVKQNSASRLSMASIDNKDGNSAHDDEHLDARWLNNFFLIFSTSTQENIRRDINLEQIWQKNDEDAVSGTVRSIIDDILYQSNTCFQMEYVIMGYLKILTRSKRTSESPTLKIKNSLLEPGETASEEASSQSSPSRLSRLATTHFCAVNFQLRKFAMIKIGDIHDNVIKTCSSNETEHAFDQKVNNIKADVQNQAAQLKRVSSELDTSFATQFKFVDMDEIHSVHLSSIKERANSASRGPKRFDLSGNKPISEWQHQLRLTTRDDKIIDIFCIDKKEKQLWLAEFSRAICWADGASPVKATRINNTANKDVTVTKTELLLKEIEQIEPAQIENLSMPSLNFFFYKNFVVGYVKVKVNNFDSILRTEHKYPTNKLKLYLKEHGSVFYMEQEKKHSHKIWLDLQKLEAVALIGIKDQHEEDSYEDYHLRGGNKKPLNYLLNKMIKRRTESDKPSDSSTSNPSVTSPFTNETEIKTDFGFRLKTEDSTYTFFTWSPDEAILWVRVLSLIIEMVQKKFSVDKINPFDYEKLKKLKASQRQSSLVISTQESAVMSQSSPERRSNGRDQNLKDQHQDDKITNKNLNSAAAKGDEEDAVKEVKVDAGLSSKFNAEFGQVKLVGIESQKPPVSDAKVEDSQSKDEVKQAKQESETPKMQLNNGAGLAIQLQNCNVQQILIHVNSKSELANIGLTNQPVAQNQTNVVTANQPQIVGKEELTSQTDLKEAILEKHPSSSVINENKEKVDQPEKPQMLTDDSQNVSEKRALVRRVRGKQLSTVKRRMQKQQAKDTISNITNQSIQIPQIVISDLERKKVFKTELPSTQEASSAVRCQSSTLVSWRQKLNDQSPAHDYQNIKLLQDHMKIESQKDFSNKTQDQDHMRPKTTVSMQLQPSNRRTINRVIKLKKRKVTNRIQDVCKERDNNTTIEMNTTNSMNQEPQKDTIIMTRSSIQFKNGKSPFKNIGFSETSDCSHLDKEFTIKFDDSRNKKGAQSQTRKEITNTLKTLDQGDRQSRGTHVKQSLTSCEIMIDSGAEASHKQDIQDLVSDLPTFERLRQSAACPENKLFHPQILRNAAYPSIYNQVSKNNMTSSKALAERSKPQVNFEQLIEKQRDLNFLDKLIAQGDQKYGGGQTSKIINQQFAADQKPCNRLQVPSPSSSQIVAQNTQLMGSSRGSFSSYYGQPKRDSETGNCTGIQDKVRPVYSGRVLANLQNQDVAFDNQISDWDDDSPRGAQTDDFSHVNKIVLNLNEKASELQETLEQKNKYQKQSDTPSNYALREYHGSQIKSLKVEKINEKSSQSQLGRSRNKVGSKLRSWDTGSKNRSTYGSFTQSNNQILTSNCKNKRNNAQNHAISAVNSVQKGKQAYEQFKNQSFDQSNQVNKEEFETTWD